MSRKILSSFLVESARGSRSLGRCMASFATSFLLQALAMGVLVVVPLMATDTLPTPQGILAYIVAPARTPAPSAAPRPLKRRAATARKPVLTSMGTLLAPVAIPAAIEEASDFFTDSEGLDGVPEGELSKVLSDLSRLLPAKTPPQEPVRVGGNIRAPRKVAGVEPVYPELAKEARVQGVVILEAIIDTQGSVTHLRVLRSIPLLDDAAIAAVRQWKYEPTLLNGVPVPIVMTVTVRFVLRQSAAVL